MTPRGMWLRVLAGGGGAAAVLALFDVPPPTQPEVSRALAISFGIGCGIALFSALAQQLPPLPRTRDPSRSLIRVTFLVAWAAVEEIVWRWLVLGALAAATGWAVALGVSSIGFAASHRVSRGGHLATGATFGVVYLATGRLVACIAAHAAYNLVLAEALARSRLRPEPA